MAKTNKVSFVPGSDLCSFIGIDVNLGDWSKVRLGRQLFLLSLLLCALFIAQLLQLNVQIVFLICTFVFLRQRPNYLPVKMTLLYPNAFLNLTIALKARSQGFSLQLCLQKRPGQTSLLAKERVKLIQHMQLM